MKVEEFIELLNVDFWTGVPDSQLKVLCDYLVEKYDTNSHQHIIAANEGNAVALATGFHLATGKIPAVYMQNSGEGNVVNPLASLMNEKVYGIPCVLVIGWRGEPGVHDESQHIFQGEITLQLLEMMQIKYMIVDKETSSDDIAKQNEEFKQYLSQGKQVAYVVRKGAFCSEHKMNYRNENTICRETILEHIVKRSGECPIISTTGKASRELFEIRERNKQSHKYDFLTVGSMGHSSSIALGVALNKKSTKVICIDGDGALLMHMGAMAVIGANAPENLVHIVINNGAHETVGGMPTVADKIDIVNIAKACGYPNAVCVDNLQDLDRELEEAMQREEMSLIEIKTALGARDNLGRPTTSAMDNKKNFMDYLKGICN